MKQFTLRYTAISFFIVAMVGLMLSDALFAFVGHFTSRSIDAFRAIYYNIFSGIISASILAFFIDAFSRRELVSFMRSQLLETVIRMNNVAGPMSVAGAIGFSYERNSADFNRMISESETSFCAIGTSLPDVTSFTSLEHIRKKILKNNAYRAKFLIINPFSIYSLHKRLIEPYRTHRYDMRSMVHTAIESLYRERENIGGDAANRLEARMYCSIPTLSCVFTDKEMNISFYDEIVKGNDAPTWTFEPSSEECIPPPLYDHYRRHFDTMWNKADSIDIFSASAVKMVEERLDRDILTLETYRSMVKDCINILEALLRARTPREGKGE